MPYKRKGSRFWQCRRRNLPGYGDTGKLTSRVTDRRTAERMELLLEELAHRALVEPRWTKLLDAVCLDRTITLPELLRAKARRRLPALLRSLHDPLLTDAYAAYQQQVDVPRAEEIGWRKIFAYVASDARLSWLSDAANLQEMFIHYDQDLKRNTVRRQVVRAASKFLRAQLGNAERNRIFADVDFPAEDDTREVLLSPDEIQRLLECCKEEHHELYVIVLLALLTSADRGMLVRGDRNDGFARGLLAGDVRLFQEPDDTYSGEVFIPDTKTRDRQRTVPFGDLLARELLLLVRGKGKDEPVFSIAYRDLDYPWKQARTSAGLPDLRFKDLRAQTAIYGERAGIPLTVMTRTMGHGDERMTRRYQRHQAVMSGKQARALEAAMLQSNPTKRRAARLRPGTAKSA